MVFGTKLDMNSIKTYVQLSQAVNGASASSEIEQMLRDHFDSLLISVTTTTFKDEEKQGVVSVCFQKMHNNCH